MVRVPWWALGNSLKINPNRPLSSPHLNSHPLSFPLKINPNRLLYFNQPPYSLIGSCGPRDRGRSPSFPVELPPTLPLSSLFCATLPLLPSLYPNLPLWDLLLPFACGLYRNSSSLFLLLAEVLGWLASRTLSLSLEDKICVFYRWWDL